jgi:hypothetical protein
LKRSRLKIEVSSGLLQVALQYISVRGRRLMPMKRCTPRKAYSSAAVEGRQP